MTIFANEFRGGLEETCQEERAILRLVIIQKSKDQFFASPELDRDSRDVKKFNEIEKEWIAEMFSYWGEERVQELQCLFRGFVDD